MLKSYGWGGGGWVAYVILVSPQSQLDFDFDLGLLLVWFGTTLGLFLGLGRLDLGLELDN